MPKARLEAFSDGVIAIIITIMVLELRPPQGAELSALKPLLPTVLGYALSFIYIGIYWNNHHHIMRAVSGISGSVMWANSHLLFWMSLIPFATAWMEQSHFARGPVAVYGLSLSMTGFGFRIFAVCLVRREGRQSALAEALNGDRKTDLSIAAYAAGVAIAFFASAVSLALYALVAAMWILPDRRVAHLADGVRHGQPK
jgi:uncharacterized membrane protein